MVKRTNLFIVGEPKCGTTALGNFLNQHPDIFMSNLEIGAFASDLMEIRDRYKGLKKGTSLKKSKSRYKEAFADCPDTKIIGEGTTGNLFSKTAAENIHGFNPDAKIIIMLREPVSFLYSLHSQFVFNMDEPITDFAMALAAEKNRKELFKKGILKDKRMGASISCVPSLLFYSERVKFTEHIARYFKYFKKNQIKIIFFEEFKNDNSGIYKEVLEFLDVDSTFRADYKIINPNKVLRFKSLRYIFDKLLIWKKMKKIVPFGLYNYLSKVFYRIIVKEVSRKNLDCEYKIYLMKKYKYEVIKLGKYLGKNVMELWGYDKI